MRTLRELQIIHLTGEVVARATTSADALTSTVNYRDSNQTVKKKIRNDHSFNKLGEEAVYLETL